MKKTVIIFALAIILVCIFSAAALAADEGLSNFTKVNTYPEGKFTDVPAGEWYAASVQNAFELDLVKGESDSRFAPNGSVNIAAAITLACRIHSIYYTGEANFVQGNPWYQVYVDYAIANGIIRAGEYTNVEAKATRVQYAAIMSKALPDSALPSINTVDDGAIANGIIRAGEYTNMEAKATRVQYAAIMSKALPDSALPSINTVDDGAIPDVTTSAAHAADIYKLYRAGILTGSDTKGTFHPQSDIKRSEVAALVTRMADESLRKSVTLKVPERVIVGNENYHGHVYTGGASSTKYHYEADCAGKYSHEITWEEVDARHLQPCATCVLK